MVGLNRVPAFLGFFFSQPRLNLKKVVVAEDVGGAVLIPDKLIN